MITATETSSGRFARARAKEKHVPKIAKAFLAPEGRAVRFQRNNTWWTFELDSLDPIDTILVIEV